MVIHGGLSVYLIKCLARVIRVGSVGRSTPSVPLPPKLELHKIEAGYERMEISYIPIVVLVMLARSSVESSL